MLHRRLNTLKVGALPRLHNTIKISAPAERVWMILGNPTTTNIWIPGVASVRIDGNKRLCTTIDGKEIIEDIEDNAKDRSFRYNQIKVPLPVKNSRGMMAVRNDHNGSLVLGDVELEVLDHSREPEIIAMIDGYYKQTLESLRQVVEKGK